MIYRRARLSLLGLALFLNLLLVGGGTSWAHPFLQEQEPGPQAVLPVSPPEVVLTFREFLNPSGSRIDVLDAAGNSVVKGQLELRPGNARTAFFKLTKLPPGEYLVQWEALSAVDGHEERGAYRFTVAAGPAQVGAARQGQAVEQTARPTLVATAWKWTGLLSALVFVGWQLLRLALRGRAMLGTPAFLPPLAVWQAAYWFATWRGLGVPSSAGPRLAGVAAAMVIIALVAALGSAFAHRWVGDRSSRSLAYDLTGAILGLVLLSGFTLTGHAAASATTPASALAFDLVHLTAAALWLGSIAALLRGHSARLLTPWVAAGLAVLVFTGLFAAEDRGVALTVLLQSFYGQALALKVALVALMAALGGVHTFVIGPRLGSTRTRLWWIVVALEGLVALGVVGATAVLTLAPPPRVAVETGRVGAAGGALALSANHGPTLVELQLTPDQAGANSVQVRVDPGSQRPSPRDVKVRILPGGDWVRLSPIRAQQGAFFAGQLVVPQAGRYDFEVTYRVGSDAESVRFIGWPVPVPGALELIKLADETMSSLSSVRVHESLSDGKNTFRQWWWYVAPDRAKAEGIDSPSQMRIIGRDRWLTDDGKTWKRDQLSEPVRVPDFSYAPQATEVRLLGRERVDGEETFVIGFRYEQSLTRFKAWIQTGTYRVLRLDMIYPRHNMTWLFGRFNVPVSITPPADAGN